MTKKKVSVCSPGKGSTEPGNVSNVLTETGLDQTDPTRLLISLPIPSSSLVYNYDEETSGEFLTSSVAICRGKELVGDGGGGCIRVLTEEEEPVFFSLDPSTAS